MVSYTSTPIKPGGHTSVTVLVAVSGTSVVRVNDAVVVGVVLKVKVW